MYEVFVNKNRIDLSKDEDYSHVFQVNRIGEPTTRQANYTPALTVPKTEVNVRVFDYLSINGDASTIPYNRAEVLVMYNKVPIMVNGWVSVIKSTEDNYTLAFYDGNYNFFKKITDKTVGFNLDLSSISHKKTLTNVINSQYVPLSYCYLFGDYGGLNIVDVNGVEHINIDYQIPAVKLSFLIDKIKEFTNTKFNGSIFSNPKYLDTYITYPKSVDSLQTIQDISFVRQTNYNDVILTFTIPQDGTYDINVTGSVNGEPLCVVEIFIEDGTQRRYISSFSKQANETKYFENSEDSKNITYSAGDIVTIYLNFNTISGVGVGTIDFNINVTNSVTGDVSFTNVFKDFQIIDLMREFFVRFGLTMIPNKDCTEIEFLTIEERLNTSNIIDWSSKYNNRIDESYVYDNLAQSNNLKLKYNDKESNYNDGVIVVENVNLTDKKDIFTSRFYSPEKNKTTLNFQNGSKEDGNELRVWDKKVTKKTDGVIETTYNGLDNRFFWVNRKLVELNTKPFYSQVNNVTANAINKLYYADSNNNSLQYFVDTYYDQYKSIINKSRVLNIELNIDEIDVNTLDLSALYYFYQEQAYFILDKLQYKTGKMSIGTFVKINK